MMVPVEISLLSTLNLTEWVLSNSGFELATMKDETRSTESDRAMVLIWFPIFRV